LVGRIGPRVISRGILDRRNNVDRLEDMAFSLCGKGWRKRDAGDADDGATSPVDQSRLPREKS